MKELFFAIFFLAVSPVAALAENEAAAQVRPSTFTYKINNGPSIIVQYVSSSTVAASSGAVRAVPLKPSGEPKRKAKEPGAGVRK